MERTAILNKEKNFVSCVLYLHNDGAHIRDFLNTVCGTMEEHFEKYEIVCVNDCCMDNTIEEIHQFLEESRGNHVVSMINLSFYQGVEMAMNAGRDLAVGDFLFEFDRCLPDFEPSLIMDVYYRALEGYDVVAAAPRRDVALTSRLFYAVYNLGSRNTHKLRQERFRIISRRAVNRVNQMNAYIPYRKAMYMNCGLRADTLVYENKKKAEAAKKRYTELIDNWYEVSTNNIEKDNELIMMLLNDYIERARKDGRKSFNFVHGSIKYRKPADKIKYVDEKKIIEWLKANNIDEFLKTSYSIDKVPFKKSCEINDKYFYYKGKQVPGMHMEECPAEIIMPDKTRYSKEPEFSTFENSQWGQLPFDSDIPF